MATHTNGTTHSQMPSEAAAAVLKPSVPMPAGAEPVRGVDFNNHLEAPLSVENLVSGMANMGFQASALAEAALIINNMITWRDPEQADARTTIFLGYTSNLVSSGLREVLRYLVEHCHVHAIVTTTGGIEEDIIKCLGPTYLGSFDLKGSTLRESGWNRIGNLIMPNENYIKFQNWLTPILDEMLEEQESMRLDTIQRNASKPNVGDHEPLFHWTPSTIIERLGARLNNDSSVLTWASRNGIPIFCPALTDGSLGDNFFFHSFKSAPRMLDIDINRDIHKIYNIAINAKRSGLIILGGGLVKHHIANANEMRNGAESAVYINTGQEFDGSDSGARPEEAISWGKIKSRPDGGSDTVKVFADATIAFPLLVEATFVKHDRKERTDELHAKSAL